MKEYLKNVWMHLRLMNDLLILGLIFIGGSYLLGVIITAVTAHVGHDQGMLLTGSIMTISALEFFCFFAASEMYGHVNYSLAMGQTRRQTMPAYLGAILIQYLIFDLCVVLLHGLERVAMSTIFDGMQMEDPAGLLLSGGWLLALTIFLVAVSLLFGALIIKFGHKAFFGGWLLMMASFLIAPRVADYASGIKLSGLEKLVRFLSANWQAALVTGDLFVSAICILITWLLLRRQQVTL